ncbi:hypothetical protein D9V37_09505 [Nocardioides mangrovicus]|uniref:Uncharacterized protein n=1 Tax=Nocardioides mangrovicus TaxID=2478913 RepID=A0A3L8P070_9ACTN|nr:hypothetical protein [Nocardioides mangrovicus]RLV48835.1 hypothetical protein D9V37_09505 [Nocardioides mangrovicus]
MEKVLGRIRPSDAVLAVITSGLGIWLMVENMGGADDKTRIDSTSWLLVPVFLLATVPVLFRRINLTAVVLTSIVAMAVHVLAFGWLVRCGAGLPLSLVLAYSAGRLVRNRAQSLVALVLTAVLQAVVLVRDSAAGLGVLPVTAVLGVAVWCVGVYVAHRFDAVEPAAAQDTAVVGTRA